ncbi:hypothetical protein IQ265_06510 [Nodosilinea sp. LEGE 06152]|uniref:hypothetical protein n=1 Tax=Nodosilinea sp. LEGE 06152 TaxID=2777966 RepID=UPI001880141E|nr:hypothetical protein [Nodosilinea sp. LEGE 06152]MBE9156481.1 hypothetical protein [Nodosilinea sp. LEGE 06152]
MANYFESGNNDRYDVIYPPLPNGVELEKYCFNFDLIEEIDQTFYMVEVTPGYAFKVFKLIPCSIMRKQTTPLGYQLYRMSMGRYSHDRYLSDLEKFEREPNGFLKPVEQMEDLEPLENDGYEFTPEELQALEKIKERKEREHEKFILDALLEAALEVKAERVQQSR